MTERFALISELGRGGMGVVWKARDGETGQIVALKLLHAAFTVDSDYLTRFERELELARRIHSAHVVEVLGFGARDGVPYLALEFVDGPSLRDLLKDHGPYTWPETKDLLIQITQGLADAHAAGVIHRDMKPSNILIGPDGVAKLADFGIAKGLDLTRVTGTSTLLGTPAYLAPEGPIDERSDLYSLGIIAYELLTGAAPFAGSTYQEVIVRHIREAPDLAKLPPEARDIVGRLLAKDPVDRPQRASQLLAALYGGQMPTAQALASQASAAPAPGEPEAASEVAAAKEEPGLALTSPATAVARSASDHERAHGARRSPPPLLVGVGAIGLVVCALVAVLAVSLMQTQRGTASSTTLATVPPTGQLETSALKSGEPTPATISQLITSGKLTVCSDTSYPPRESLDSTNTAVGSDIDLAKEIAKRMGLSLSVKSVVFDSLIPTLIGGGCDIVVSAQSVTADRLSQVDMIPYFKNSESLIEGISVAKDHSQIHDAVQTALKSMRDDGTYHTILARWGLESGAVP